MDILIAIFLGAVQGLTEFLPVSSSGHLVLLQKIFGIENPTLFFEVMLHAGTLIAVFAVLRKEIWAILCKPLQPLTGFLIIGTIPIIIAALVFRKPLEQLFETGEYLSFAFLSTSLLLVTAELLAKRAAKIDTKKYSEMNWQAMKWQDALVVGIMQAIAVVPGISRSGATLSGALSRGLNRDFAARFSFLLSIPAILGALALHVKEMAVDGVAADAAGGSAGAAAVIAGTAAAAVVGFFAIRFMLKIIREKSLYGFAIYTAVLGVLVIIDQFVTRFIF